MNEQNVTIGAEILAYFPFLKYCSDRFSVSHIVQIGYFNYSHVTNEGEQIH